MSNKSNNRLNDIIDPASDKALPKKYLIIGILILVFIVLGYYLTRSNTVTFDATEGVLEEQAQAELAKVVEAVGKLMVLPEGDQPVLATVTDASALIAQQAFFTGSVDGDQLLLFPASLKAIIYSPSRNIIVNAGPIEQSPTVADTPALDSGISEVMPEETDANPSVGESEGNESEE